VLVLGYIKASLAVFIWYFVVVSLAHYLVTLLLMQRAGISAVSGPIAPDLRKRISDHYAWTAILFLVLAFSNKSVETVFLNYYSGPEAVGWFAIGAALTRGGVDLLSSGLNSVLLPMMSHAFGSSDVPRAHRILSDAIRFSAFLGAMLAGVGVLWAGPAIIVLYGAAYEPAVIGLQVMMFVGAVTLPGNATSSLLMTTDRMGVRVSLSVGVVVLTLAAAALLVPRYGFFGALAAHAIAQSIIFFTGMAVIVNLLKVQLPYGQLARTIAAAAGGLCSAGLVLSVSHGLAGQFVAGIAYAAGCLAGSVMMGVWSAKDVQLIIDLLKRWPSMAGVVSKLEQYADRLGAALK
jgi:O-antigen/teichoic acid export membrane protein